MANVAQQGVNYNTPAPANDFERGILEQDNYTGYKDLFKSVYESSIIAMIVALAFSAALSAKFYASFMSWLGESAIYAGGIVASFIAYWIYDLHLKAMKYRKKHGINEPLLTALLWGLVALSVYADLSGGAEWGAELTGEAPTDTRTSEIGGIYSPQIEAINAEIEGIEGREFHWCGTHNTAHKCEYAQFYIDPKADRKHVAKIEQLKAQRAELQSTMNNLLADAGKSHSLSTAQHYERLKRNQGNLRGAGIVAVALALIIGQWRQKYVSKAAGEIKTPRPHHSEADLKEADDALASWAKENRDLREELAALREREVELKQAAQQAQATLTVPQTPVVPLNTPTPPTPTVQATSNDPKPQPLPQQPKAVRRLRKAWAALMGN